MYILAKQDFIPGAGTSSGSAVKISGPQMIINDDFTQLYYVDPIQKIRRFFQLMYVQQSTGFGTNRSPAVWGMRGPVNVRFIKRYYKTISDHGVIGPDLIVFYTKDENPYLNRGYNFDHVIFDGQRLEPIKK